MQDYKKIRVMSNYFYRQQLGILGGGQLGRMLIQAATDFNIQLSVLDPDPQAPCSTTANFHTGRLIDYDTVMKFGERCDILTIEIENVNTKALADLVKKGKKIFPQPEIIELIQDKRTQKQFYQQHQIPTAGFVLVNNKEDVAKQKNLLPAVNKLGKEGYDGRGVQVLRTEADLSKAFDAPGLLEKFVDFEKEIAVLVARNEAGDVITYPPVEMVFHPEKNLVEYLFAPATVSQAIEKEADRIARQVINSLGMVGLLAVEMFVKKNGDVLVNEIAPRPHNSGHQTIEANVTSQYEQHLRAIFNLPLGATDILQPSAMVNLLGADEYSGGAVYEGLEEVMRVKGVHVHLYGKKVTKPFRKMGHVTIVDASIDSLKQKVQFVQQTLKVIA
jgi:5-(carboxyamino)imidazole ribonucleotide synthase